MTTRMVLCVLVLQAACTDVTVRDVDLRSGHEERPLERLTSEEWVGQTFIAHRKGLCGVSVKVGAYPRGKPATVQLGLRRFPDPEDLALVELRLDGTEWGEEREFLFDPVEDSDGQEFYFYLQFPSASRHEYVAIWTYPRDVYPDGIMVLNGKRRTGDVHFRPLYRPSEGWGFEPDVDVGEPGAYWLTGPIFGPRRVGQSFACTRDSLAAVEVLMTLLGSGAPGQITFELRTSAGGRVPLRVAEASGDSLQDNQFCRFSFAPVPYSEGESYYFSVSAPWAPEDKAVSLWSHRTDVYPHGRLYINEEGTRRDLVFRSYTFTAAPATHVPGAGAHRWIRPQPTPPLAAGGTLLQSFVTHEPSICGIELLPATHGAAYRGTVTLRVWSLDHGTVLHQHLIRPGTMRDNTPFLATFTPVEVARGESLGVELRVESAPASSQPLSLWQHPDDVLGAGALLHGETPLSGDLLFASLYRMPANVAARSLWTKLRGGKPGLLRESWPYVVTLGVYVAGFLAAAAALVLGARAVARELSS